MYVYNIIEAQNKSAQKKIVNLICNMQIVVKRYLQVYIPTWYILLQEQKLLCAWKDIFHCSSIH